MIPGALVLACFGLAASPSGPSAHDAAEQAALAPPRFALARDTVIVPMRLEDGRILLDVRINGRGPFSFILDSGAQGHVITSDLASELALPTGPAMRAGSPGGQGLEGHVVTLDTLQIGGLTVLEAHGAALAGLPFPPGPAAPRGVLSPYRLGDLLVTLDYPHARVIFRRGSLPEPDGREVFGWDAAERLPVVTLSVAGQKLRAHLDSGAQSAISLPTSFEKDLPLSTPVAEIARARLVDRELVIQGAKLAGTVTLGRYTLENPDLAFVDVAEGMGNVGPPVLRQLAITLDPAHTRLRLEGPADGKLVDVRPRRYGIRMAGMGPGPMEVVAVDAGSPAEKAGLKAGDVILRMNGQPADSLAADARMQAMHASPLRLDVRRADKVITIEMKLD
jgi:hypothetical protein